MFQNINNFIKKVGYKLTSFFNKIKNVQDLKNLANSDEHYSQVEKWKELHRGYYKPMHYLEYHTVKGCQNRNLLTMNMPKAAAQEMATLIFNERCQVSTSNESVNEFVAKVFKRIKFFGTFQQKLEFMFAQGGLAIEPFVRNGKTALGYYTADTFFPISWDGDEVTACATISTIKRGGKEFLHLCWREFDGLNGEYHIHNEIFEKKPGGAFGTKKLWSEFYPELEESLVIKTDKPLIVYIKPNLANNFEPNNPQGISLYANAYDTLKLIDTIYDSYHREFKLGRKKILVPTTAVKTVHDPRTDKTHSYFDSMDETFVNVGSGLDDGEIKDIKMELRADEHSKALQTALDIFANQIGLSPGTFSFDGKSVKTATEVISENSKTFKTKKSHENLVETGIEHLVYAMQVVGVMTGEVSAVVDDIETTVTFDDSIIQDTTAIANEQISLVNNDLQSRIDAIRIIHGLSDKEAELKFKQILAERNAESTTLSDMRLLANQGGIFE